MSHIKNLILLLSLLFINSIYPQDNSHPKIHGLTGGWNSFCFLVDDMPYCFGSSGNEIGHNINYEYAWPPVGLHDGGVTQISLTTWGGYGCAIKNGGVWCWGENDHLDVLPSPNSSFLSVYVEPFALPIIDKDIIKIATAYGCICAIKENNKTKKSGALYCFGNATERCAFSKKDKTPKSKIPDITIRQIYNMDKGVTDLSMKNKHGCAIKDEEVYCWGYDRNGVVGTGINAFKNKAEVGLIKVIGLPKGIIDVAVSMWFSCGLHKNGQVYCWGLAINDRGGHGFLDIFSDWDDKNLKAVKLYKEQFKDKLVKVPYGDEHEDDAPRNTFLWTAPEAIPHPKYPKGSDVTALKTSNHVISVYKNGKNIVDSRIGPNENSSHYENKDVTEKEREEIKKTMTEVSTRLGSICHIRSQKSLHCRKTIAYLPSKECRENDNHRCREERKWSKIDYAPISEIKKYYKPIKK